MAFSMDDIVEAPERLAVITGANTGIGYETALALVKKKITVVLACRNLVKAALAKQQILSAVPDGNVDILELDLSSLSSVKKAALLFRNDYDKLDILINNAGIMYPPYKKTEDDFESQMAANCFGHFLFTSLLIDLMPDSTASRITWLSSSAHKTGNLNFDDLNFKKKYSKMAAYAQSKLTCLMYALELDHKLKLAAKQIRSNSAHPGGAETDLGRHISPWLLRVMKHTLLPFITHPVAGGVIPILEAALSPSAERGQYFGPQGFMEMSGPSGVASIAKHALDEGGAKRLWHLSEQLTGAQYCF